MRSLRGQAGDTQAQTRRDLWNFPDLGVSEGIPAIGSTAGRAIEAMHYTPLATQRCGRYTWGPSFCGARMTAAIFDTHAFVKRLTAVGMPEAQAEVLADEQARLIDGRLSTKSDLAALATKVELEAAKSEIIKWMFGTIGFQTLIILGAVITLARLFH
jgi:hypothetical protein